MISYRRTTLTLEPSNTVPVSDAAAALEERLIVKGQRDFLLGGHEISLSADT